MDYYRADADYDRRRAALLKNLSFASAIACAAVGDAHGVALHAQAAATAAKAEAAAAALLKKLY